MAAQYLAIEARHRRMTGFLASLEDFTVAEGALVDAGIVRAHPSLSLYCLDDPAQRAIFVELPPEIDLAKVPFVYQAQYDHALRLVALPYDELVRQAQALPAAGNLIMMYMTGRCGSTLLSHIFNELEGVTSLSEPDVATQFVHLRCADGSRDAELRALLGSVVRFLFKPAPPNASSTAALKLRSEGTQLADLYQAAFPAAKNLFLYRDALGWVASFYRIFTREGLASAIPLEENLAFLGQLFAYDFTSLAACLDPGTREVSLAEQLTLWWLAAIEWYLAKYDQGFPFLAIRYADLNERRESTLEAVFAHCGLPAASVPRTLGAFERDAQAGTALAREHPALGNRLRLSEAQREQIGRMVGRHPRIRLPDVLLPGTLQPDA